MTMTTRAPLGGNEGDEELHEMLHPPGMALPKEKQFPRNHSAKPPKQTPPPQSSTKSPRSY